MKDEQNASSPLNQQNSDKVNVSSRFIDVTHAPPHKNLLPIVPASISIGNSGKCFVTNSFLNPASTSSIASDSLIKRLKVSGPLYSKLSLSPSIKQRKPVLLS